MASRDRSGHRDIGKSERQKLPWMSRKPGQVNADDADRENLNPPRRHGDTE